MFRKNEDVQTGVYTACHDGQGDLYCKVMLAGGVDGTTKMCFFHEDILKPGVSIGVHQHVGSEEIYYLVYGECTMIVNDVKYPMHAGDISNCMDGHTHGIINTGKEDAKLIVIAVAK